MGCEGYSPLHPPSFPLPDSAWRPLSGLPFSCQPLRAGKQGQDEKRDLRSLVLLPFGHWTEEPRTCQATDPAGGHRSRLWRGSPAAAVTWQLRWSGKASAWSCLDPAQRIWAVSLPQSRTLASSGRGEGLRPLARCPRRWGWAAARALGGRGRPLAARSPHAPAPLTWETRPLPATYGINFATETLAQ